MKTRLIPIAVALLTLCACSDDPEQVQDPANNKTENPAETTEPALPSTPTISVTSEPLAVKARISDFELKFTQAVSEKCSDFFTNDNFITSPFSAAITMAMVSNALNDEEGAQMVNMLGIADVEAMNLSCASTLAEISGGKRDCKLDVANAFWYNQDFKIDAGYTDMLRDKFSAQSGPLDFASTSALDIINGWISDRTSGLIPSILDKLEGDEYAVWTNALYYADDWLNKFDKGLTAQAAFHGTNGDQKVAMMHNDALRTIGGETDDYVWFSNNFREMCSMIIVMPKGDIRSFEITPEFWTERSAASQHWALDLRMPRFDVESSLDVTNALKSLGMPSITELPVLEHTLAGIKPINVRQKATMKIDEDGVMMAAATVTEIAGLNPQEYQPKTLTLDRPFYFFICHDNTGSILMAGRICNI